MKRKVIQIADSTQLVSLPRKWAKEHGVKKGDELDVEEEGNKLSIYTSAAPQKTNITVDLSGLTPRLADRFLARAYQKGYDEIRVKFSDPEVGVAIRKKVPELLGYEIMEEDSSSIYIKSVAAKLDIEFDSALRKAFLIVVSMADACETAYQNGDASALSGLYSRDFEVNKFCYLCLRMINKGYARDSGSYLLYYLIETLEDVGDEYKSLSLTLSKLKYDKSLAKAISMVNKLMKTAYDFFYKPEKQKAVSAMALMKETYSKLVDLLRTSDQHRIQSLVSLIMLTRLVYHFPTMRLDTLREVQVDSPGA